GAPISVWIFRAAIIQGIQQLYVVGLWYWGSLMSNKTGLVNGMFTNNTGPKLLVITVPIAVILWFLGIASFVGLPDYYRQSPNTIPSFYMSLLRRHIVPWFLFSVVVQNYWLSAPYGRNWQFLFYAKAISGWAVVLLTLGFFVIVWLIALWIFSKFSKTHPWLWVALGLQLILP
ncbi:hypothetical protein B0T10DRAFT_597082, partial [Thelonectria olida]